jgi:LPPG:FO 2-phospho-L-lactate transferase
MNKSRILAITGGVGGAKLSLGLSKLLSSEQLSFVVNTGDDFEHLGLNISPDIDTLIYTLSGESNQEMGWGRKDESWQFMDALGQLGGETWFQLGDRDLAIHLERTRRLAAGQTLTEVTQDLATSLNIQHRIIPMSNDPVRTRVLTNDGYMDFQHYFVRERCAPVVTGFEFDGSENAELNPLIREHLSHPELTGVIICPSNPFVSIDPVLSIPGMKQGLVQCHAPVIAVSPVVGGAAIKGPTVKMMRELSLPNSAFWIAEHYQDLMNGFILDLQDESLEKDIEALGLRVRKAQTVMVSLEDRVELGRTCLDFLEQLN